MERSQGDLGQGKVHVESVLERSISLLCSATTYLEQLPVW